MTWLVFQTNLAGLDEASANDLTHRGYRCNDIGSEYTLDSEL